MSTFYHSSLTLLLSWLSLTAPLVFAQSYTGELDAITFTGEDYIIDSDSANPSALYNRNLITFSVEGEFSRDISDPQTANYRFAVRLLRGSGAAVPLDNGSGGTATTVYRNVVVTWGVPVFTFPTFFLSIAPGEALSTEEQYQLEATLQREVSPGNFVTQDDIVSAYRRFWHFTGTTSVGNKRNVLARIRQIQFSKRYALASSAAAAGRAFQAFVEIEVRRYDGWEQATPNTNNVEFRINSRLRPNLGSTIYPLTLEGNGIVEQLIAMDQFALDPDFGIKVPYERVIGLYVNLEPSAQLPTASETFRVHADLAHIETANSGIYVADRLDFPGSTQPLLHFNGDLIGSNPQEVFLMTSLATGSDSVDTLDSGGPFRLTAPRILGGYLKAHPTYILAPPVPSGGQIRNARLYDDGRAEIADIDLKIKIPAGAETVTTGGNLNHSRSDMRFGPNGLTADVVLTLPKGMGVRDSSVSQSRIFSGTLSRTAQPLRPATLNPNGPVVFVPVNSFFTVSEETKPFELFCSSLSWNVASGVLTPGPTPPSFPRLRYVREAEVQFLETSSLTAEEKIVRSNEGYFSKLQPTPVVEPTFTANTNGNALSHGTVAFTAGSFRTHFPYNTNVVWQQPGTLAFANDLPVVANSQLADAGIIALPFARDCMPPEVGCGSIDDAAAKIDPGTASLAFTADGGLAVAGPLILSASRRDLVMGYIDALTSDPQSPVFAHDTSIFSNASFLSAGHFLSGQTFSGNPLNGPGVLLNSGFAPAAPANPERPGSGGYLSGNADYPGLNYRVAQEPTAPTAVSVLGGVATPTYTLGPRSKYYLRQSGVTGIHEPAGNPFTAPVEIYGYEFEFDQFALSFVSSQVHDSRTSGSLYIPDPASPASGFTVAFKPLMFSCLGALTTATLDGGPFTHRLSYWNADIRALAASFTAKLGADCDPGAAYFTLGVEASASNVTETLSGALLFHPNGDLVTAADPLAPPGHDSRLGMPTTITITGPGGEHYLMTPMHAAYLNRHAEATPAHQGAAQGVMNLSGMLDVAFFEPLPVHLITGARKNNITDRLHFTGGWSAGGQTFFDADRFDLENRGYPPAATLTEYQEGAQSSWRTHATQNWLDVIAFDYELRWDSTARAFRSWAPVSNDFMVLNTRHKLQHLSAKTAELDFGASLEIEVPELNLGALTRATPLYGALHSVADKVTDTLLDGLDSSDRLLKDLVDDFYQDIFAITIDPITDALAAGIRQVDDDLDLQDQIDDLLDPAFDAVADQFKTVGEMPAAVAAAIDQDVGRMQLAIRSLIGTVELDAAGNPILENPVLEDPEDSTGSGSSSRPGIFSNSGTAVSPKYDIATNVLTSALATLDPSTSANLISAIGAASLGSSLDSAFAKKAATIEQVKATLADLHNALGSVRSSGALTAEIQAIFTGSGAEIDTMIAEAKAEVRAAVSPSTYAEWTEDELNTLIRNTIRDKFNASLLVSAFHNVLRSYVYELDAAMRSGIDSAFAQINRIILDLLDEFLPVSGPMRGFLGDLAGSAASGKIDGYARINGAALRTLRLDADFQCSFPDPFAFNGYLEINQLNSTGSSTCGFGAPGDLITEVKLGADDVKVGWLGKELRFDVDTKFTFNPAEATRLVGMAGAFEMTSGSVDFEAFKLTELGAAAAFGVSENYLAAKVGLLFNGDTMRGGIFFGRTCSLDPLLLVDADVGKVLPQPNPTLTGVYAYGQAFIPIVNVGCLFSLSANAGAGIFAFQEDNTIGGKMLIGASARALCAVNVGGEIVLVGVKAGNDFNFLGSGRIYGSAGVKPLKVTFDKKVTITYKKQKWDYDY
jgi:hypothetical protein